MKVAVIGDRDTTLGFSLAGVHDTFFVSSTKEAYDAFLTCTGDPEVGIILIDTQTASCLDTQIEKIGRTRHLYPVILTIPGGKGREQNE